jgi:Icc-related predicted phosphoesterase
MAATPPPRIFAVSDVHSDYPDNLAWVESLAGRYGPADAIIVAGDVSDCTETLLRTLRAFKAAFHSVFFVPGNHDVWLRSAERDKHADSLAKWRSLEAALESAGVSTTPARVGSGPAAPWVVPMLSWYEPEWDTEPDIEGAAAARDIFTDFRACVWPRGLGDAGAEADLAAAWDALNEPALTRATDEINRVADGVPRPPVISVSHFLPVQSCLPEKRYLFHPALAKACGSRPLAARVAALRPDVHVFGWVRERRGRGDGSVEAARAPQKHHPILSHTHIAMDTTVDGVRYVQHPLRYPAERRRAGVAAAEVEPQKIFDCAANAQGPRALTHWSQHYDVVARNPADVTPAPWVVASWGRRGGGGKGGGE